VRPEQEEAPMSHDEPLVGIDKVHKMLILSLSGLAIGIVIAIIGAYF